MSCVSIKIEFDRSKKVLDLEPNDAILLMPRKVKDAFQSWLSLCDCDGNGGSISIRYNGLEYSAFDSYWD